MSIGTVQPSSVDAAARVLVRETPPHADFDQLTPYQQRYYRTLVGQMLTAAENASPDQPPT